MSCVLWLVDVSQRGQSEVNSLNEFLARLPSTTNTQMTSGHGSPWLIETPTMCIYA